ncbi:MAG: tRNA uridine-5-carboxymethylaminomethyl(34) synthesis GTPase MnmE, partial [Christensenellales bacterium]
ENGRIDLSQAEGVMDAVAAQGELAQKAAVRQISGQLSRAVAAMQQDMTLLLAKIGATVDYPEEDLEDEARTQCRQALQKHESELSRLLDGANTARRVREGVRVALWGRPNVGKSSLLNALLGDERAIVTPIAGTTRDTLEETLIVEGLVLRLIDTAGFREAGDDIEAIGVRRARKALEEADMALLVLDASQTLDERDIRQAGELPGKPLLVAVNKSDLPAKISLEQVQEAFPGAVVMPISALSGDGIEALMKQMVKTALGTDAAGASEHLLGNPRHIEALKEAQSAMLSGIEAAKEAMPPDILAIDIRAAWRALGRITGQTCDEDVIDAIFEHFCVGK